MKQKALHVKKGDQVVVISGAARGQKGTVLRTFPSTERVVIEGVNLRRKHVRPRKQGEKGQIVTIPASIHASNIRMMSASPKVSKKEVTPKKTKKSVETT